MVLEITPQQRFNLYNLVATAGFKLKGQEARRFRRFCRQLGLDVLAAAETQGKGQASTARTQDTTPAAFEVDADTLDRLFRLAEETERTPFQEQLLGPLFDAVESLKAGGTAPDVTGALPFAETVQDWLPPAPALQAPEDREVDLIVAFLKTNGAVELAERIDKGDHRPD